MKPIRHIFLLLVIVFATSFIANAQAINPQWLNGNGGIGIDQGKSVAKDKNGFFYSLSEFSDVITIGANTYTSAGSTDLLLLKYNSSGQIVWSKQLGSTAADVGTNLFVDTLGYLYVTGNFSGPAFNYGSGSLANFASGRVEIFVLRMDTNGSVLWAKSFRGLGDDYGGKIFSNGKDVLVTGYFQSSNLFIDADVLVNLSFRPIYLARFDSAGVYKWSKAFGGGNTDIGTGITMDANGNIYMSGNVGSTNLNFGNGVSIVGTATPGISFFDVFLTRFNGDGLAQWSRVIKGASLEEATDLEMDEFGNAYLAGFFNSTLLDFGSFSFSNPTSTQQFYIARYDSTGVFKWAVKSSNTVTSRITDISLASANQIYTTGYFSGGPLNLDVSLTNTGSNDVFWLQVDSMGVFQKSGSLKGADDDRSGGITATSCSVILNGSFRSLQLSAGSLTVNNTNAAANDIFHVMLSRSFPYALPADTLRICENTTLLDAGSGYNSYYWNTNSRLQQITADVTGRYGVKVFNSEACYGEDSVYVAIVKANIFQNDTIVCKGGAPILLQTDTTNLNGTYWFAFNRNMTANWSSPQFSTIPEARYRMTVSGTWAPLNWPTQRLDAAYLYNLGDNSVIRSWVSPADNPAPFLFNGVPLRPLVDQYRADHIYDYRFTTSGLQFGFSFNEGFTADNSGALDFSLYYLNNPTTTVWSTGQTSNSILVDPANTTKYYVTVTDGFATCKDSINITVLEAPLITLEDTIKICADSVELDAGPGADTYQWSNGATTQKTKVYAGGKYYVTVKNSIGCERMDSVYVSMFRSNILQNDTAICKNSTLTLDAQTTTGHSYSWSTGASSSSISITTSVDTKIYLQTNNGYFTCTDSIQVNTLALPVLSVPDTLKICGTTTTLDAGTGFTTYQWSTGELTQTINVVASGKYYIDVTNAATCGVRDSVYVSLINAVVTQNDTAICKGNSLVLNVQNVAGYTYSWSNGAVGLTTTVTPLVNTKYYLTATDGIGSCKDSVQIDVLSLPVTSILDTIKVCGTNTSLDAGAGFATYQWSTGATSQTINVSTSGKYYVTVTNAATCSVKDSIYASIVRSDILQGDTTICKGSSLLLPAFTQGSNTYSWSTGQTGTSILVSPLANTRYYLYSSDGIQTCTDSTLVQLHVINTTVTPQGPTTFCAGGSVTLKAVAGYSYQWKKNGVVIAGATLSDLVVDQTGNYKAFITNAAGCIDSSLAISVTVNALPTVTLSPAAPIVICEGSSSIISAMVVPNAGGATQYQWSLNAAPITGANAAAYSVTAAGSYTVAVTNSNGCVNTSAPVAVSVSLKPVVTITNTLPVSICSGASQTINATINAGNSSIVSRQWYKDGVAISGANGNGYLVTVGGQYRLEAINAEGCLGTSAIITVVESALPTPTLIPPAVNKICRGAYSTITATGGTSYEWYLDAVLIPGATGSSWNAVDPGTYTVKATNAAGCSAMAAGSVVLTVIEPPSADFSIDAKCAGAPTTFTNLSVVAPTDIVNYTWTVGDGTTYTTVDASHVYTRGGNYTVTLSAASTACSFAPSVKPVVINIEQARAGISYAPINAVAGRPTALQARNFGQTYNWTPALGLSNTRIPNPVATIGGPQTYNVQISTVSGCVTVDTVLVRIFSRGDIFVPTGFTPNNDGKNDRLYPILAGMNSLTYFKVYNRWGNLVYETKSSDPANGWNGMYNGQMQPVETYVWMAEGIDIDGNKIQRKGTAVLIR